MKSKLKIELLERKPSSASACSAFINKVISYMSKHLVTAIKKEYVVDLTKDEITAICFFAEVPYVWEGDKFRFKPCALRKERGTWTVYTHANLAL